MMEEEAQCVEAADKAVSVVARSAPNCALDDAALRAAFDSVIRRHAVTFDALRLSPSFTYLPDDPQLTFANSVKIDANSVKNDGNSGKIRGNSGKFGVHGNAAGAAEVESYVRTWVRESEKEAVRRRFLLLKLLKVSEIRVSGRSSPGITQNDPALHGNGGGNGGKSEGGGEDVAGKKRSEGGGHQECMLLLLTAPRACMGYDALWLLIRELKTVYESVNFDAEQVLPPLQLLPEALLEQRQALQAGEHDDGKESAALKFWQQELKQPIPLVNLPSDKSKERLDSAPITEQESQFVTLPALEGAVLEALRRFSAEQQVSLEALLFAAFCIVLHRHSNQEEIVVACLVNLAERFPGAEELPLALEDFIPLQSTCEDHPSIRQYLQRIARTLQRCRQNSLIGWQRLVKEVVEGSGKEEQPSHTARDRETGRVSSCLASDFAAVAFEYYDLQELTKVDFGGVEFERFGKPHLCSSTLLQAGVKLVCLRTGKPSVLLALESNTSQYAKETIRRIGMHFCTVLSQLTKREGEELHVADVELMSAEEREQVLRGFNATHRPYAWIERQVCVHELVEEVAQRSPDAIAFESTQKHTFKELNDRANQLANFLQHQNGGEVGVIPVVMLRGFNLVVAWLAVLKAGGAIVTLDPGWPLSRILSLISDVTAQTVLTELAAISLINANENDAADDQGPLPKAIICDREDWRDAISLAETSQPASQTKHESLAHVLYTSGTTGEPKGVMITHGNLVNYLSWHCESYKVRSDDVVLWNAGLGFDAAMAEVWGTLVAGARLCPTEGDVGVVPKKLLDWIEARQVTLCFLTTQLAEMVIEEEKRYRRQASSFRLRCVYTGGDRLHFGPRKRSLFALANIYGPTENTVASTMTFVSKGLTTPPLIGRPVPNTQCYVLDSSLRPCPIGIVGELFLAGAQLSPGYFRRPELNVERFLHHSLAGPNQGPSQGRLYRTGDLVRWTESGELEFFGRKDFQVKIRGCRVELSEIECCLLQLFSVKEAVVHVRQSERDKILVAYCVGPQNTEASKAKLRQHVQSKLPAFMIPSHFLILPKLPLTGNHKVDHRRLQELKLHEGGGKEFLHRREPRNPTEAVVARVFSSVFRSHPEAGNVCAHFIKDLGGSSLDAARITSKICHEFKNNTITVSMLYKCPTVETYAKALLMKLDRQRRVNELVKEQAELDKDEDAETELTSSAWSSTSMKLAEAADKLSLNERSLWFYYACENPRASSAYNVSFSGKVLSQNLDFERLRQALLAMIKKHDVLRTQYVNFPSDAQDSDEDLPVKREVLDAADVEGKEFLWEVHRIDLPIKEWLTRERYKLFDLAKAPLLRVHLLNTYSVESSEKEQYLLIVLPHIITDLWSFLIFLQELFQAYSSPDSASPSTPNNSYPYPSPRPSAEPALSYASFAAQQHHLLNPDTTNGNNRHYSSQTKLLQQALDDLRMDPDAFPYDMPRPKAPGFRGASHRVELESDVLLKVQQLSRTLGVTLNTTLFTSFFILVWQHTRVDQVVLGTPMAGRAQPRLENTLGYLVNVLPLGLDMAGNPSFIQLVKRLNAGLVAAMDYESVPLGAVKRGNGSGNDVPFRMVFAMQEAVTGGQGLVEQFLGFDGMRMRCGDVELDSVTPTHQHSQFDLVLMCCKCHATNALLAAFQYDTELFHSHTIHRLAERWLNLIRSALDNPHAKLLSLPCMLAEERSMLLSTFNATDRPYAPCTVHSLFQRQAKAHPHRPAFLSPSGAITTYQDLDRLSNKLAKFLLLTGLVRGSCVPVLMHRSSLLLVAWLAVLKVGSPVVPLDDNQPAGRLSSVLAQTKATHVVTEEALAGTLAQVDARVVVLDDDGLTANAVALLDETEMGGPEVSADDVAFVVFTSGSTGEAKGVILEHRSLTNYIHWHIEDYAMTASDRVMSNACLAFDAALAEILPTLACGACVLPTPSPHTALQPAQLLDWMEQSLVTLAFLTTQLAEMLLQEERLRPRDPRLLKLRLLFTGGERLRGRPRVGAGYTLVNIYGPTECTINVTKAVVGAEGGLPLIGSPVANMKCYVVSEEMELVGIGVYGELCVAGVQVGQGYWHRPEMTKEKFVENPFVMDEAEREAYGRLYKTGDIARWDASGQLEFKQRKDTQIKIRGFRVEPAEVEHALLKREDVSEAICICHSLSAHNKILVIYFTSPSCPPTETLKAHMKQLLPVYMRPALYIHMDSLPLTPNHKIDHARLPPPDGAALVTGMHREGPQLTAMQSQLQKLWARVLGLSEEVQLDVKADFFEMGGNSLAAARAIAALKEEFNVTLSLAGFLTNPTIHGLEILIKRQQGLRATLHGSSSATRTQLDNRRHSLKSTLQGKPGSSIDQPTYSSSLRRTRLFESASISSGKLSKYGKLQLGKASEKDGKDDTQRSPGTQLAHAVLQYQDLHSREDIAHSPSWLDGRSLAHRYLKGPADASGRPMQSEGKTQVSVLSYNQQSLWFLHNMDNKNVEYVVHIAAVLPPTVNLEAVLCGLQLLVDLHPSLRTTYDQTSGSPYQVVHPVKRYSAEEDPFREATRGRPQTLQFERWSRDVSSREEVVRKVENEIHKPWDLAKEPPFRARVIEHAAKVLAGPVLVLTAHHIAMDGFSVDLLWRELEQVYPHALRLIEQGNNDWAGAGPWPGRKEEKETVATFARRQKEMLEGSHGQALWKFWQRGLANYDSLLTLPADFTRPRKKRVALNGAWYHFQLELTEALRTELKQSGATLFMLLLATFSALIHRYTGKTDLLVGSPMACRHELSLEQTVGNITNLVALRVHADPNHSLHDLLRQVRTTVIAAYDHQAFPFSLLVERLASYRDPSVPPLVQLILSLNQRFHASGRPAGRLGDLKPLPGVEQRTSPFDMQWIVNEAEDGRRLACSIQYRNDLFSERTVANMSQHLSSLFHAFGSQPAVALGAVDYLGAAERDQLLVEWSNMPQCNPTWSARQCVHQLFEAMAEERPLATAVTMGGKDAWTYGELNARANILAHYLRQVARAAPGARVAVVLERTPLLALAVLAVLKAGCAYVPLDIGFPRERMKYILQDAGVDVVVCERNSSSLPLPRAEVFVVELGGEGWAQVVDSMQQRLPGLCLCNPSPPLSQSWSDDNKQWHGARSLAYVVYTSGSTGSPKGVKVDHRSLVHLTKWHVAEYAVSFKDRASQLVGAAFDPVGLELWPFFTVGASVHFVPEELKKDVHALHGWLDAFRVSITLLPTPLAEMFLKTCKRTDRYPSSLRVMYTGGDKLNIPIGLKTPFRLDNHYGPAEATIMSTFYTIPTTSDVNEPIVDPVLEGAKGMPSFCPWIGRPIADCEVYVVDPRLHPVPCLIPGELLIGGVGLGLGYINRPELTKAKWISTATLPFQTKSEQLYRTGDLVRWRHDGNLEFIGRVDSQVKIRGVRVELSEIKSVLQQHTDMVEACVLAREDHPGRKRICAYVVLEDIGAFDKAVKVHQLRSHVKDRLPEYMIPVDWIFLESVSSSVPA